MRFRVPVGLVVAATMAVLCANASAAVYCVPSTYACGGTSEPTLAAAVTAANGTTEADDILLAEGTFAGGVSVGAHPVHIHGAGKDRTTIEGGPGTKAVYIPQPDSSIDDLTIHALPGGHTVALDLSGRAERVVADVRDNPVDGSVAVYLRDDGSFEDGAALASLASPHADYGLKVLGDGAALVSYVDAQGRYAMTTDGAGNKTLRFVRATGDIYGLNASADNTLLEDSTITGAPVVGYLFSGSNDILTTLRHVTLNGGYVGAESDNHKSTVIVSNSAIVAGGPDPETPDIQLQQFGGTARVEVDYSFFRASHAVYTPGAGIEYLVGAHNVDGFDAKLLNLLGGDLRPRFDSPLVDAGDPVPAGGEPMADLAGEPRTVNGRADIGAYEYGRHAPTLGAVVDPSTALVGEPLVFRAGTADEDPSESPVITWTFDDGFTAAGSSVTHAFSSAGTHAVTAKSTDPAGETATVTLSVPIGNQLLPRAGVAPRFPFKKLRSRKGVVRVRLTCPVAAAECSGRIELQLARKPKAEGLAAKTVVLGRARYTIAHGTSKTIRVKLTRSARKRLRRAQRGLNVRVVARPKGAAAKSKTVRLTGR